jgi:hypothetical protein
VVEQQPNVVEQQHNVVEEPVDHAMILEDVYNLESRISVIEVVYQQLKERKEMREMGGI